MTRRERFDQDILLAIERLSSRRRTAFAGEIAKMILARRQEDRKYRHWLRRAATFRPRAPSEREVHAAAARLRAQGYPIVIRDAAKKPACRPPHLRLVAYNPKL